MSKQYRYKLDPSPKKFICPSCGKKSFVRYKDGQSNEYLPEKYGRCDRENKCAYMRNPYTDGYAGEVQQHEQGLYRIHTNTYPALEVQNTPIPFQVLRETLHPAAYRKNVFIQNLLHRVAFPFGVGVVEEVVSLYYLGTIKKGYMQGATTFPFIDKLGKVRAIQVKTFDTRNHTKKTNFLHAMLKKKYEREQCIAPEWLKQYLQNDSKVSCLFGEHLLDKFPTHTVGLVEAPKTAVYASLYFGLPDHSRSRPMIWLATYNLSSLHYDRCKVLAGRKVILFPDLSVQGNAYAKWYRRAREFEQKIPGARFVLSDLLEQKASPPAREEGLDLADYLIQLDWREFQ